MKLCARTGILQTVLCCAFALSVAPAAQASFGVTKENFEAGTCESKACTYATGEFFTQAAGHPPWGITAFEVNSKEALLGAHEPEGALKRLRVDVPPGLAADPEALPKCPVAEFDADKCTSAEVVGEAQLTVFLAAVNTTIAGTVYNLEQPEGLPLEFGIHVEVPLVANEHILLEGHVSDLPEPVLAARHVPSGDYHEWFQIDNISKSIPILKSKLLFDGTAGNGNFLTLPSVCSASTTSYLEVESYEGAISTTPTTTPVGVDGCAGVPFKPTAQVSPETAQYDSPDGVRTEVKVPQFATSTNTADIKDAKVVLPEGLTLNPSAAHGLSTCSPTQFSAVECPAAASLGTATIETDLPPGTLKGNLYLGNPAGGPITHPPYTLYLLADARKRYGVLVKLQGEAETNATTGRVEVGFANNPQLPFSDLIIDLNGGPRAPLANPLTCGAAATVATFTPYTGLAAFTGSTGFSTGGCPSPLPFLPSQSTKSSSSKGGAFTSFTFNAARADGQQYLSKIQTVLPAGLVGLIPSIKLCQEPQAAAGSCSSSSQIGTVKAVAGAGAEPYEFSGPVYLTGPTGGAPYGLSIPIETAAGPFDLGRLTTRIALSVDPHTAQVIASGTLPKIFKGVPLRLRSLSVAITKSSFLFNPTYCGALSTGTTFTSTLNAAAGLSTPFQVSGCSSLPFKPVFAASSPSVPSRANGASLIVGYTQPGHQANIKSVVVQLPSQLPSRDSTLHLACTVAVFAVNPLNCPKGSKVGSATVTTPVLPEKLTGPAYLVSHGGAAFPDLDLILEGDHGVRVVLEGNTNIKKGITTSTFASVPDVPVSSFQIDLPTGPYSALGSFGSLCSKPLYLPTAVTAQSGAISKQHVRLSVGSCHIKLLSHRIKRHTLIARVQVFTAGRVSLTGKGLHAVYKRVSGPGIVTIKAPVSIKGRHLLASGRQLKVRARVGFNPRHKNEFHSAAFAKVTFRH